MNEIKKNKIDDCLLAIFENVLSDEHISQLDALLKGDKEAQLYYIQCMDLQSTLKRSISSEETLEAYREVKALRDVSPAATKPKSIAFAYFKAAAMIAVCLGLLYAFANYIQNEEPNEHIVPDEVGVPVSLLEQSRDGVICSQTLVSDADLKEKHIKEGLVKLNKGKLRFQHIGGPWISVQAPAKFNVNPSEFRMLEGTFFLEINEEDTKLSFHLTNAKISHKDARLGISITNKRSHISVFSGQITTHLNKAVSGFSHSIKMFRDDSLRFQEGQGVISKIIGDHGRYKTLKAWGEEGKPLIANANFEYPMIANNEGDVFSASGWVSSLYPMANANEMPSDKAAGLVKLSKKIKKRVGVTNQQAGFVSTNRTSNDKMYHTSLHQRVGPVVPGKQYILNAKIYSDDTEPAFYTFGLYSGTLLDGPMNSIEIVKAKAAPLIKSNQIEVSYETPWSNVYKDLDLFVRIEILPSSSMGKKTIYIDEVDLKIKDREHQENN